MGEYLDMLLPHWPLIAASGAFYVFNQTMKKGPLSPARAKEIAWVRFIRRWFPLPLHPLVLGVAVGCIPGIPVSPGVEAWAFGPELYYLGAGTLAVLARDIFREWQKYRGVSSG